MTVGSQDSSVGIVTGYGLDGQDLIPSRGTFFLFSIASRPALGLTQPPIQWVPRTISPGKSDLGVKLTTHPHLVLRARIVKLYLHSLICLNGIAFN
jgi:hypothetical protein